MVAVIVFILNGASMRFVASDGFGCEDNLFSLSYRKFSHFVIYLQGKNYLCGLFVLHAVMPERYLHVNKKQFMTFLAETRGQTSLSSLLGAR